MAFLHAGGTSTQGPRSPVVPQDVWDTVKTQIIQLYMTNGKTLKQVMAFMKLNGFSATRKQYKTQFRTWGLRKNRRRPRMQPSGDRTSDTDDVTSSVASGLGSVTPEPQQQAVADSTYHQRGDSEFDGSHSPAFQQQFLINGPWEPRSGALLHIHQPSRTSSVLQAARNEGHPYMYPAQHNAISTVSELLSYCNNGLTHTILLAADITEIERVIDFMTLVGSPQDAFKIAQALLSHIAAIPTHDGHISAHLAQAAANLLRNARVLWDCDQILSLLRVVVSSGAGLGFRDDKHWHLLLSFFGLVSQGSTGALPQHALELCHTAVRNFGRMDPLEIFDWRYLVVMTNLIHAYAVSGINCDGVSVWRAYYNPGKLNATITNIDGYLEGVMMWCTAALDDAESWEAFDNFSAELWTDIVKPADVIELECKTVFCYFYRCLHSKSHVTPHSRCHVLLQEALRCLRQHLSISTCEALSAISRMLMLSNYQPYSDNTRSNLAHRALCRIQEVKHLKQTPGILTASGWPGSSLSAIFLETLTQSYCHPYRFTDPRCEKQVNEEIRKFLDRHLELKFSMNAFMPDLSSMGGEVDRATASLVDVIMYEVSAD